MGLFDGIITLVSAVGNAISNIASKIGVSSTVFSGVAALAASLIPGIGPALSIAIAAVGALSCLLGVVPKDVQPAELGARALQHPEINRDDFESYDAYKNALLNAPFDKEKYEAGLKDEPTKLEYEISGFEIEHKLIEEKYNMAIDTKFWEMTGRKNMKAEDCKVMLDSLSNNKVQTTAFVEYVNDPENGEKTVEIDSALDEMKKGGVTIFDK